MNRNPYNSPLTMPHTDGRGVGWWLLALAAGALIGVSFACVALPTVS